MQIECGCPQDAIALHGRLGIQARNLLATPEFMRAYPSVVCLHLTVIAANSALSRSHIAVVLVDGTLGRRVVLAHSCLDLAHSLPLLNLCLAQLSLGLRRRQSTNHGDHLHLGAYEGCVTRPGEATHS